MSQRRRSAGFFEEIAAARGWFGAGGFIEDFYGDVAVQHFVLGAVDNTHTAFADFRDDAAMAQDLADQWLLLCFTC